MCYEKEHIGRKTGKLLGCEQFRQLEQNCDNIAKKNEKELIKKLLYIRKKMEDTGQYLRSTAGKAVWIS